MRLEARQFLRDILEAATKNKTAKPGSLEQKVGDFYASCMDQEKIEAEGIKPIEPEFQRINAIKDGENQSIAYIGVATDVGEIKRAQCLC